MRAHLDAVGWIDVLTGAFFALLGGLVSAGTLLFAPWFYGGPVWRPEDAAVVLAVVLFVSAVFLAIGIPSLVAGIGLRKRKGWARVLGILLAVLAVASFPIGTVAGVYALWVLTHKETERVFAAAE